MARYEEGNLAYKLPMRTIALPQPKRDFEAERRRRDEARRELIQKQRTRQDYRLLSSIRVRRALAASALVVFSALLLAIPVWRNAMIIEANYANVGIQNEIYELQRNINVREGQMLEITDLLSVRDRAYKSLGMQAQTPDQVKTMPALKLSTKTVASIDAAVSSPEATIEAYVKSRR